MSSLGGLRQRRKSVKVMIGDIAVGGGAPVMGQSMTNTDTADAQATANQIAALADAGSEVVRITVDRDEAAKAVPRIREMLDTRGYDVPIVGDFHYIGHKLLSENPTARRRCTSTASIRAMSDFAKRRTGSSRQ